MANILLLEDDKALGDTLARMLEGLGHTVATLPNGLGWQTVIQDIDLIITVMFMPEKDGIETLREMREDGFSGPTLAISGGLPLRILRPTPTSRV